MNRTLDRVFRPAHVAALMLLCVLASCAQLSPMLPGSEAASSVRQRQSINRDWRFAKGDPEGAGDKLAYATIKDWMMATGENLVVDADAVRHTRPAGNVG